MEIRYYRNPETGLPHIYDHGVTEAEAESRRRRSLLWRFAAGTGSDENREGLFVVTAYSLTGQQLKAFRRRRKKREK
jgi:hypothetical protein